MLNNILLPIEQIGREFDYKLLLASMCSEDDLIFIGQHDYLYFISKFMTMPGQTIFNPADAKEIFSEEELN